MTEKDAGKLVAQNEVKAAKRAAREIVEKGGSGIEKVTRKRKRATEELSAEGGSVSQAKRSSSWKEGI